MPKARLRVVPRTVSVPVELGYVTLLARGGIQRALLGVAWHGSKLETLLYWVEINEWLPYWIAEVLNIGQVTLILEWEINVPIYHSKITELPPPPRYIDWPSHLLGGGILHDRFSYNFGYNNFLDISLQILEWTLQDEIWRVQFLQNSQRLSLQIQKYFLSSSNIKTLINYKDLLHNI